MKKAILIGAIAGILFSIWDTLLSYSDSAPIDVEPGLEIISWSVVVKTMIYMLIGGVAGGLIMFMIKCFNRSLGN
ncbi:hypothetical protein ACUN24_22380 [Pedobacter sp. WC2501]|uniref:hypothetical protein n=1 Tax=Pedobacter sp. WC2501 TaxID=3461400 RepID=UPI0040466760